MAKYRHKAKVTACEHKDREHKARGMCASCYRDFIRRHREQRPKDLSDEEPEQVTAPKKPVPATYGGPIYGDWFEIMNNPTGDLIKGRKYRKYDFSVSLAFGNWPNGLRVRNHEGTIFTVQEIEEHGHCLVRDDEVVFKVNSNEKAKFGMRQIGDDGYSD